MEGGAAQQKPREIQYYAIRFPINNFIDHKSPYDGAKLHNYRWPANEDGSRPRGVIIMFHGYGSNCDKFAYIAKLFVDQGFDVLGYDYKGFGHSEGVRGKIEDRHHFYDEAYQYVKKARQAYAELYPENCPPFLTMGYSQGCALQLGIARYLKENGDAPLAGQIFVVPNFGIQQDHWTEEYKQELEEKAKDPETHLAFPAKPLKDVSFLLGYVQDPLQFKGPHYARTIQIIKDISPEDIAYIKDIAHPVHITYADGDNILRNEDIRKFYETISTPAEQKEIHSFDSDHYILSDGWLYEEVVARQNKWLDKIFPRA